MILGNSSSITVCSKSGTAGGSSHSQRSARRLAAIAPRDSKKEGHAMPKVNIDQALYDRVNQAAAAAGYSGVEELIVHAIENELKRLETERAEERVSDQLRGLGYIE